jgi:hypothetical protein
VILARPLLSDFHKTKPGGVMKGKTNIELRLLIAATSIVAAGCANDDDICTLAARHLESCTGVTVAASGTCDTELARRVVGAGCADIAEEGTRSPQFLGSLLGALFNGLANQPHHGDPHHDPHHGDPHDPHHGDPHHGDPNHGEHCKCDVFCDILHDCCYPGCGDYHQGHHEEPWHGLEEPGGGNWGNNQGGWCSYQGGNNWRRCRQCGWQYCLPSGSWAPCQRPSDNKFKSSCGWGYCGSNGHCQ